MIVNQLKFLITHTKTVISEYNDNCSVILKESGSHLLRVFSWESTLCLESALHITNYNVALPTFFF